MSLCRRPMLSYDVTMTVWLVGLLAILSVTSAFSASKAGDRLRRMRTIELASEGQSSSIEPDVKGLDELHVNGAPATILTNDADEYPSADKSKKSSVLRRNLKDILEENDRKVGIDNKEEEVDEEKQLHRDYVRVARSTNDFARSTRRPVTSSTGRLRVVVDLLVVVDNKLFRKALQRQQNNVNAAIKDIEMYYRYVIILVDSTYTQIQDSELTIRVRLAGIYIAQSRSESSWSEDNVLPGGETLDATVCLEKFREWLKEKQEHGQFPKFDHAMAFTGYNMTGNMAGYAHVGTICQTADGLASSIIWERGGLSSAITATHELGHGLGSDHDGKEMNTDCPGTLNYIMASDVSTKDELRKNFFLFSPCTIRQIKVVLGSKQGYCLFDSEPDKISVLPGQIVSYDDRCKDFFHQDLRSCDAENAKLTPEQVCRRFYCWDPTKDGYYTYHSHLTPVLGTPCAVGKVCINGECMETGSVWKILNNAEAPTEQRSDKRHANWFLTAPKSHDQSDTPKEEPAKRNSVDRNASGIQVRAILGKTSMPDDTYARDKTG